MGIKDSMVIYMDSRYIESVYNDALDGIDEAELALKTEGEIDTLLLKEFVKTWTRLAKKYAISKERVDKFYEDIKALSNNASVLKTIDKESIKMEKQMKKIWGAQSTGAMEEGRFAGKPQEEAVKETTTKKLKQLHPKRATELLEKGFSHFIIEEKLSDATIIVLLEAGATFIAANGTSDEFQLVQEEPGDNAEEAVEETAEESGVCNDEDEVLGELCDVDVEEQTSEENSSDVSTECDAESIERSEDNVSDHADVEIEVDDFELTEHPSLCIGLTDDNTSGIVIIEESGEDFLFLDSEDNSADVEADYLQEYVPDVKPQKPTSEDIESIPENKYRDFASHEDNKDDDFELVETPINVETVQVEDSGLFNGDDVVVRLWGEEDEE